MTESNFTQTRSIPELKEAVRTASRHERSLHAEGAASR